MKIKNPAIIIFCIYVLIFNLSFFFTDFIEITIHPYLRILAIANLITLFIGLFFNNTRKILLFPFFILIFMYIAGILIANWNII